MLCGTIQAQKPNERAVVEKWDAQHRGRAPEPSLSKETSLLKQRGLMEADRGELISLGNRVDGTTNRHTVRQNSPCPGQQRKEKKAKEVPIFVSSSHGLRGEAVSLGERGRKKGGKSEEEKQEARTLCARAAGPHPRYSKGEKPQPHFFLITVSSGLHRPGSAKESSAVSSQSTAWRALAT